MDADKKKVRVQLRKNRTQPPRGNNWTRDFNEHGFAEEAPPHDERVRAKGDLSRYRTIIQDTAAPPAADTDSATEMPSSSAVAATTPGRVIRVHGLQTVVETDDGRQYRCAVRGLLKSLMTDERSIVTTGDRVHFRPAGNDEGMIERVEPRRGTLTRSSRRREHVLVANIDQLVIVMSLVAPDLKPHLIDRYIASAIHGDIRPILCLNKADLVEPWSMQTMIGAYSQLGIVTILTSATTGEGVERLREQLSGRATVFSGQSGVGKSSLLNAIQPHLALRVKSVSQVNQKGRHTTTTSELIRLDSGGWVVDTPGVRQLQLWNVAPEEVEMYLSEFKPYVALCSFPDCTHTHEKGCAVKAAVDRREIGMRRYHSYLGMFTGADADR